MNVFLFKVKRSDLFFEQVQILSGMCLLLLLTKYTSYSSITSSIERLLFVDG